LNSGCTENADKTGGVGVENGDRGPCSPWGWERSTSLVWTRAGFPQARRGSDGLLPGGFAHGFLAHTIDESKNLQGWLPALGRP